MHIDPLKKSDYAQWRPLFDENNLHSLSDALIDQTWQRLHDPKVPINGFALRMTPLSGGEEVLAGLVHYVLHPVTGANGPACYMEDLFIHKDWRRQGLGKMLVKHLARKAKQEDWCRLYWFADKRNEEVQKFYADKELGIEMPFGLHFFPMEMVT